MKITPNLLALKNNFSLPVSKDQVVNRFVWSYVYHGKNTLLFDAGVAGYDDALFSLLLETGAKDPKWLFLTHAHPDHMGGAASIKNRWPDCRVAIHENEEQWVVDPESQFQSRPVPGFHGIVEGPVPIHYRLTHGETVGTSTQPVTVFEGPGHSHGHCIFWLPAEGAVICGDALPVPGEMPIYTDLKSTLQTIDLIDSIEDAECLLSAWDEHPLVGEEIPVRLQMTRDWIDAIDDAITDVVNSGDATDGQSFTILVAKRLNLPPYAVNPLFAQTLEAHLKEKRNIS